MSLENIKISRKLIFAFSLLILIAIIQSLVILYSVNTVTTDNKTRTQTSDSVLAIEGVGKDMLDLSSQLRGFLLIRDEAFAKGVAANYAAAKEAITKLRASPLAPAEQTALDTMQNVIDGYIKNAVEPEIALARNPTTYDRAMALFGSGVNKEWVNKFKAAQQQFLDLNKKQLDELRINFNASLNLVWYGVIIGGIVSVIIAFAMSMVLQSQIAKPIIAIAETMRRLAGGDTSVTIPSTDRRDEIGEMAQAVQVFKQMADSERTGAAAEQAAAMSQLAAGLKKLAAGDLSNTLSEGFSATYAQIRNDFNEALTRLKETISTVLSRTHSIETGTREISSAADDLSKRTEQQAASLEETAAALEEITATVKRTAANAKEAGQIVDGAKQAAEDGGRIVGTAIAAMNQIEQSSKQITDIIGVIDEIAFQTNLLALNAGVEAARAGEAGRGFAVVASEVRALAQRSSEAAKQIKSLIKASGEHVGSGVKLVDETGKSLNGIVAQVLSIASLVKEIAQAAEQQSSGIEEVNVAVSQMDQATQQNAAMVEQSTAACRNLSAETTELSELISVFNIGSETVGRQPLRARNEISARPAAPRLLAPQRRAGNTALATKAAPAEDWQEF